MNLAECCKILEIRDINGLGQSELRKIYLKKMKKYHSDNYASSITEEERKKLDHITMSISEAYKFLSEALEEINKSSVDTRVLIIISIDDLRSIYSLKTVVLKDKEGASELQLGINNLSQYRIIVKIPVAVTVNSKNYEVERLVALNSKDNYKVSIPVYVGDINSEDYIQIECAGCKESIETRALTAEFAISAGFGITITVSVERKIKSSDD